MHHTAFSTLGLERGPGVFSIVASSVDDGARTIGDSENMAFIPMPIAYPLLGAECKNQGLLPLHAASAVGRPIDKGAGLIKQG